MPGLPGWSYGNGHGSGDRGVQYSRIVPEAAQEPTYAYLEMDYGASAGGGGADGAWDDKEPSYGFGKGAGRTGRSKAHGKRARDAGYSSLAMAEERDRGAGFYRTHLFLNPAGACQGCSVEEESVGAGLPPPPAADPVAPRRSSVTLIKWPSSRQNSTSGSVIGGRFDSQDATPTGAGPPQGPQGLAGLSASSSASAPPSRQVSFNKGGRSGAAPSGTVATASALPTSRSEPVSLASLDRDCFIIPLHAVDRFLPEGVPLPEPSQLSPGVNGVKVLQVGDPLLSVLLHLMTPLEPLEPLLESPLASPHKQQGAAAADLVQEMSKASPPGAVRGMLLTNMEKNSEFPYISYYVINSAQTDPKQCFRSLRSASLRKFDPRNIRYTASHTLDLFNEVATIARPPFDPGYPSSAGPRKPPSASTGYIVSFYKVFEGDDGRRFEKNWLYWTGARMLYRYLPRSVGLRRITLHKSISQGDKLYLLLVECANFLDDLSAAAVLIPALRARLCGYTGIYRAVPLPAPASTPS
ncbi:hypothetical protein ONE63_007493 [Megalurothrips usitatus]|uniref:DUF7153 domain-containing protein n=1 Tax=Megalurothrips usitatus TaxID=439358 RepID=A0AAV7XMX3_9NEOP|nr:hypothetical protein ONE63_007493 [Megalurothrips usitatus]